MSEFEKQREHQKASATPAIDKLLGFNSAPTLADLRAAVTEAEAAYGRFMLTEYAANPTCAPVKTDLADAIHTARAALRKAEEEAKRPRLASVGEIVARANAMSWPYALDTIIQATREDMLAACRNLPLHGFITDVAGASVGVPAVLLSDIEALVRDAQ